MRFLRTVNETYSGVCYLIHTTRDVTSPKYACFMRTVRSTYSQTRYCTWLCCRLLYHDLRHGRRHVAWGGRPPVQRNCPRSWTLWLGRYNVQLPRNAARKVTPPHYWHIQSPIGYSFASRPTTPHLFLLPRLVLLLLSSFVNPLTQLTCVVPISCPLTSSSFHAAPLCCQLLALYSARII